MTDRGLVTPLDRLRIKLFADGADVATIARLSDNPLIQGFTTNPTLMRQAQVPDYEQFAHNALEAARGRPISFEVFSDYFGDMRRQALKIRSWGDNVYVKIPITNTRRESAVPLIGDLARNGVKVNVTAILTLDQVRQTATALAGGAPSIVSVFAGRIADTGRDPVPLMTQAASLLQDIPQAELLWASPRELLNIYHAETAGCRIITVTHDLLKKLDLLGKDLDVFSLETVKMFHDDAQRARYTL